MHKIAITLFAFFGFILTSTEISANPNKQIINRYSIESLPENFFVLGRYSLNDLGQIVGCTSNNKFKNYTVTKSVNRGSSTINDPLKGAKAAFWDPNTGIKELSPLGYKTIATSLNDNGLIAITLYETEHSQYNNAGKCVLWDINTGNLKQGPKGSSLYINNASEIVTNSIGVWNTIDNSIRNANSIEKTLLHADMTNKKGNILQQASPDIILCTNNRKFVLLLDEGKLISNGAPCNGPGIRLAHLNDKDSVVVISKLESASHAIIRWDSPTKQRRSAPLETIEELSDYKDFEIVSYNNRDQILLRAYKHSSTDLSCSRLFLLTPYYLPTEFYE